MESNEDVLELTGLTVVVLVDVVLSLGGKVPTISRRNSETREILMKTWTSEARDALGTRVKTAGWTHDWSTLHIRGPPILV